MLPESVISQLGVTCPVAMAIALHFPLVQVAPLKRQLCPQEPQLLASEPETLIQEPEQRVVFPGQLVLHAGGLEEELQP